MRDNFITTPIIIIMMKIIINENACVCARDSLSNTKVKWAAFAIPWFSYNWLMNIGGPQSVELVRFRSFAEHNLVLAICDSELGNPILKFFLSSTDCSK